MKEDIKYYHDDGYHGFSSPEAIVPLLIDLFQPESVIDIGCGTGNFLSVFKQKGVRKVLGIDGPWARKDLLFRYLDKEEFLEKDLEKPFDIHGRFDLSLCLEVAEHIDEKYADTLVANLCSLSDTIVFSAAIPFQGGQNHVNEQWPSYWERKFSAFNFEFIDCLRPIIWNDKNIDFWYRQNILVASNKSNDMRSLKKITTYNGPVMDLVHPEMYSHKTDTIQKIFSGNLKLYASKGLDILKKKMNW